jgi:hypothetical protein
MYNYNNFTDSLCKYFPVGCQYAAGAKKRLRLQEGNEEKGLACDTLKHVALTSHEQRGIQCL